MRSEVRTSTVPRSIAVEFGRRSGNSVVQISLLSTPSGERNSRGAFLLGFLSSGFCVCVRMDARISCLCVPGSGS